MWGGYAQKISSCTYSSRSRTISEWQSTRCIILFVISRLYEENIMKKYLFGLGAMLVGAGLMFVFTHTEVSAENRVKTPEPFVCTGFPKKPPFMFHCETTTMDCGISGEALSCVKKGMFK